MQQQQKQLSIRAEQIALLYDAIPLSVVASVINASIVAAVLWNVIPAQNILIWYICTVSILVYRYIFCIAYKRSDKINTEYWATHFTTGAIITGCAWGASSIWLFPAHEIGYEAFLAFVIAGMSSGASTSLSYLRLPIYGFLALTLTPLAIRFFTVGETLSYAMGTMVVLYGLIVFTSSKRIYLNTLQNITLRHEAVEKEKALRSSEARYQYLFDSAPLAIIYYNENGKVINFNNSFLTLFGVKKKDIVDKLLTDIIANTDMKEALVNSLHNTTTTYKGIASDFIGNRNTDIRVYSNRINDNDGSIIGGMSIIEDISEDRRIERMKNEFISMVSHELRTPLTSIRGAIKLLQGTMYNELNAQGKELIDISNRNTDQLLTLINDILDTDKIESGEMEINSSQIDIMSLIDEAVTTTSTYNHQNNVTVNIRKRTDGLSIDADENRLNQVLFNMLSNAVKFATPDSNVYIDVTSDGSSVKVEIINTGEDIPNDFLPEIFNRFTQADSSTTRQFGGSGLGLYISKEIIEKHGGKIGVESKNNTTTFWFEIPFASND